MIHLLKEKINMFFVCLLSSHTSSQGCRLWGKNRGKSLKTNQKNQGPNPALITHELDQIQTYYHPDTCVCGQN